MKKQNKIVLGLLMGVLLISLASAGIIGSLSVSKLDFNKDTETTLMSTNNITKINVTVSDMICNDDYCTVKLYQEGLMNINHRLSRSNCVNTAENFEEAGEKDIVCTEKTEEELETEVDEYVKQRLDDYAVAQEKRNNLETNIIQMEKIIETN